MSPARRIPKPTTEQAFARQLDTLESLSTPSYTSSMPSSQFDVDGRGSRLIAPKPGKFDTVVQLYDGLSPVCLPYEPIPLSERVDVNGDFANPNTYVLEDGLITFTSGNAPAPGSTVQVSYAHYGYISGCTPQYLEWAEIGHAQIYRGWLLRDIYNDNPAIIEHDEDCYDAYKWTRYTCNTSSRNYLRESAGGFTFHQAGYNSSLNLGTADLSIASRFVIDATGVPDPGDPNSAFDISSYAWEIGAYVNNTSQYCVDPPYIPADGAENGSLINQVTYPRGSSKAILNWGQCFRSGLGAVTDHYRSIWDFSTNPPVRVWDEFYERTTSLVASETEPTDDPFYTYVMNDGATYIEALYRRDGATGKDNLVIKCFEYTGSSLIFKDEITIVEVSEEPKFLGVWASTGHIGVSSWSNTYSLTGSKMVLLQATPAGISLIREEYGPGSNPESVVDNPAYRTSTTDDDAVLSSNGQEIRFNESGPDPVFQAVPRADLAFPSNVVIDGVLCRLYGSDTEASGHRYADGRWLFVYPAYTNDTDPPSDFVISKSSASPDNWTISEPYRRADRSARSQFSAINREDPRFVAVVTHAYNPRYWYEPPPDYTLDHEFLYRIYHLESL